MKTFKGLCNPDQGCQVFITTDSGTNGGSRSIVRLSPPVSQQVRNHSPDGFQWGYCGSGPAQLALALLLDVTDLETALRCYQKFKECVVARLPRQMAWELTEQEIKLWLENETSGKPSENDRYFRLRFDGHLAM